MPSTHIPPHLAEPQLRYAREDEADAYLAAVVRGFHGDYVPDLFAELKSVAEYERFFGFTVEDRWIATCGAYSRVMTVPGGQLPVAAVTIVTVAPSFRRRGLLNQMMQHQLESVVAAGVEPVALLWASESLIYGRYGYGHAVPRLRISGATRAMSFLADVTTRVGFVDEVSRDQFISVAPKLHQRLLSDRPGALNRSEAVWRVLLHDPEAWRHGASALRFALHFALSGEVDGYGLFRVKEDEDSGGEVQVVELDGADVEASAALWRFVLDLDLVRSFSMRSAPADEMLRYVVADPRAIRTEVLDGTYARIVNLPAALEARHYSRDIDLILSVTDPLLAHNHGNFRLQTHSDGASVTPTRSPADVSVNIREVGTIYLGGTPLTSLQRAGLVQEHRPGSVWSLAAAFSWPRPPFCPDFF
jgi:predicted acetyltransferase